MQMIHEDTEYEMFEINLCRNQNNQYIFDLIANKLGTFLEESEPRGTWFF